MLLQYSSEYNRATWIANALDAGFASAMSIQPKWLRDICSVLFSIYYIVNGDEADSKVSVSRWLMLCTVVYISSLQDAQIPRSSDRGHVASNMGQDIESICMSYILSRQCLEQLKIYLIVTRLHVPRPTQTTDPS